MSHVARTLCATVASLLAATLPAGVASARQVELVSPHPVPHKYGGGFCTIDVPHVHNYLPADPRLYREDHGRLYFVGDPTPFGYQGPRYAYYGAHPVVDPGLPFGYPVYCYLKGPHFHWYQPPPKARFQLGGGAYWYVGAFPRWFYDARPRHAAINEAYAAVLYTRPVIDVAVAPPVVRATLSLGGPGWTAHAVMASPPEPVPAPVPVPVPAAEPPPPPLPVPLGVEVGVQVGGPALFVGPPPLPPPERRHPGKHRGPPARFVVGPAPVRQPIFERRPGATPRLAPAARVAPAPRAATPQARTAAPAPRAATPMGRAAAPVPPQQPAPPRAAAAPAPARSPLPRLQRPAAP